MTNKYLLWFKNRWLWLGSLLVSLLITTGWLYESLSPEADHLVGPVGIENALVKRLDIAIQYPASLSADDRGSNAKHLIVTTYADAAPTPNSVLINLKAPIGVINFLDKDGNRITGLINLPITRGDMPTSVRLEHANTSLAASLQEVPIETSILRSAGQDDIGTRVPELDLRIKLEPVWRQHVRNIVRSGLGSLAPISLLVILVGFSIRRHNVLKRIQPIEFDIASYEAVKRWDKAADKCQAIIDIDPAYDDILRKYRDLRNKDLLQQNRLAGLHQQARNAYDRQYWTEAQRLLKEIAEERHDYKDTIDLLTEVNRQVDQAKELDELFDRGVVAEVSDNVHEAIKYFRLVIAKAPQYEDAQTRLNRLEASLSRRIAANSYFMRMLLAEPNPDLQYFASLVTASKEDVSERFLELVRDKNVAVRRNLAAAITHFKSPVGERVLHELLDDQDEEVRAIASFGLRQQEEIEILIKQLGDPDKWIDAGDTLIKLGSETVQPLISALAENYPTWERAARILEAMGDIAHQALIAASHNEDSLVRDRALSILNKRTSKSSEE